MSGQLAGRNDWGDVMTDPKPQEPTTDPGTIGGPAGPVPAGFDPQPPATGLAAAGTGGRSQEQVAQDLLDQGGGATGVSQADLDKLLAQMSKMQQQLDHQAALQGAATQDDVHKYALAVQAHLQTKQATAGSLEAREAHGVPLDLAGKLVDFAAAKDGQGDIPGTVDKIHSWITRHLRRNPSDYEYVRELLDELADAHEQTAA